MWIVDNMDVNDTVRILKDHLDPRTRSESYSIYSKDAVHYLKNVGLLDCYFDYSSGSDMIFTTDMGKRYVELQDDNAQLDDLRDIVMSSKDFSKDRNYRDAVRKAVAVNNY